MSAFCEDSRNVKLYPKGIFGEPRDEKSSFLRCLQWASNIQDSERDVDFHSSQELIDTAAPSRLQVAFLSNCSDKTSKPGLEQFRKLNEHFAVPSEVLTERMRSVNHAFGSSTAVGTGAEIAWCHFLCRQIDVRGAKIQNFGYLRNEQGGQNQTSSALNLWIMCDFFLHVESNKTVMLLCFGAPDSIVNRFEELLNKPSWNDVLQEPYLLLTIVFDELHDLFDTLSKKLAFALRKVEEAAINQAGAPQLSFKDLHEVQKNCTFMIETAEAIMSTLEAMQESLKETTMPTNPSLESSRRSTINAIAYRKRTFKSTLLRVYSLEKRALSSIQVYQALVTQADSHAMKFIAVLTLVFLPVTGVSTVFLASLTPGRHVESKRNMGFDVESVYFTMYGNLLPGAPRKSNQNCCDAFEATFAVYPKNAKSTEIRHVQRHHGNINAYINLTHARSSVLKTHSAGFHVCAGPCASCASSS